MEQKTRLYLDLDGVMADFDRAYFERWGESPRQVDDSVLWANINGCPDFFADMHPCQGALAFYQELELAGIEPIILTACPKVGYPQAAGHKRAWAREHLSPHLTVLPVMGGRNKALFMHAPGDILIDDYRRNTEAWTAAGGVAILHRTWEQTRDELAMALDPGVPA